MSENATNETPKSKITRNRLWLGLGGGFLLGVVVTGLAVWLLMPGMMLVQHDSQYSLDETVDRLKTAIEAHGWEVKGVRDITRSVTRQGRTLQTQIRIVELCQPDYAGSILTTNPEVATLMPCAFGVWEDPDGVVHISGMNMGLMGKMFGGNIAKIMGSKVSKDEHAILAGIVAE